MRFEVLQSSLMAFAYHLFHGIPFLMPELLGRLGAFQKLTHHEKGVTHKVV